MHPAGRPAPMIHEVRAPRRRVPHLPPDRQAVRAGARARRPVCARVVLPHVDRVALRPLARIGAGARGRRRQLQLVAVDSPPAAAGFAERQRDALLRVAVAAGAVERELYVFGVALAGREGRFEAVERTGAEVHFQAFVRHGVGAADFVVFPGPAADVTGFEEGFGGRGEEAEVWDGGAPGEDGFIVGLFDDFFLQAEEGLFTFSV